MLRLVAGPKGGVWVDRSGKLPGRGAWLCAEASCVAKLIKRPRALHRALRVETQIGDLEQQIHRACLDRLLETLSLAARGGCVVSGHQRLLQALQRGGVEALVLAGDIAQRTERALLGAAPGLTVYPVEIQASALGSAVGKGPRAALAVRPGTPSQPLVHVLRRYAALGYPPPRHRSGDRPDTTRRQRTTGSRGCGEVPPSSSASSHSKRG